VWNHSFNVCAISTLFCEFMPLAQVYCQISPAGH
jgi:hypothetical protein